MSIGNYNSPVDFRIAQSAPENLPPQLRGVVDEVYTAINQIILTFINECGIDQQTSDSWPQLAGLPDFLNCGNLRRLYVTASELLPFGSMISLHNVSGGLQARNANATDNTKPADGFCSTPGGIPAGTVGEVQLSTGIASINGLVAGTRYYLSTVAGLITNVKPVAAGNIEQYIGVAITASALYVNTGYWIQH